MKRFYDTKQCDEIKVEVLDLEDYRIIDQNENQETSQPKKPKNADNSSVDSQSIFNLPKILDGIYFKIVKVNSKGNVIASCTVCENEVLGSVSSTGNYLSHIKHRHIDILENCKSYCQKKIKIDNYGNKHVQQTKLPSYSHLVPGNMIEKLILNYIIDEMRPINTVEKPAFRKMLEGISDKNLTIPSTNTIKSFMTNYFDKTMVNLKELLKKQTYVCTTADAWSCHGISYLGMTVHFIDDALKRHFYIMGFEKLTKKHTFEKIICDLNTTYDIVNKVTHTVTDGGSNFCKSFRCYSKKDYDSTVEDSDDTDTEMETEIYVKIDFSNHVQLKTKTIDDDIFLQRQMMCPAYLFHLIPSDAQDYINGNTLLSNEKNINRAIMGKLQSFWNVLRSDDAKNTVYEECQCHFPVPNATKWNSIFDAIQTIWTKKDQIQNIFERLKLEELEVSEWTYLEEYIKLMKPVAQALNILQEEDSVCLGYILPTVISVQQKIEHSTYISVCNVLRDGILFGIKKRFNNILDLQKPESKMYILASISHPKFKLSWVPVDHYEMVKNLFVEECISMYNSSSFSNEIEASDDIEKDDFFSNIYEVSNEQQFEMDSSHQSSQISNLNDNITNNNIASFQALAYLDKKRTSTLITLNEFPLVKKVFVKYNTTMPSSASVERLFSNALQIFTPGSNPLDAETFKKLLFLKGNSVITPTFN